MVRPGMKRLRQAHSVKVQPNKTGTSFIQGHSVVVTKGMVEKKGVVFNSTANTPYNDLANSNKFEPSYTKAEKDQDRNCKCAMKKSWPTNSDGNIIAKSWNFSWQK
jgi:hypothetical protein|tara:strand:- start:1256 stop:1573 length:318 start_codon:yes stop_codon:yes gene_type:complete